MQLNSLGSNFHSNLSSIQLSHSSFYRVRDLRIGLVLVLLACSLVYQQLGSFHLGSHISQLELCILESGNGLSELLSFLGVSNGSLQSALCNTQSLGSNTDTSAIQSVHCDLESLSLLAQHVLLRDTAVGEDQLVSGRALDTHLLFLGTEGKSGSSLLNDKGRDLLHLSASLLYDAGNCNHDINICFFTIGDEALGTIDDPLIAI